MTAILENPPVGYLGVTGIQGWDGAGIALLEELDDFSDRRLNKYRHAFIVLPNNQVMEAETGGAIISDLSKYQDGRPLAFGTVPGITAEGLFEVARRAALYEGVHYGWLDYVALLAKRLHLPSESLERYVDSTDSMICSQLVARAYYEADWPLFGKLWSGDVTPKMLARAIGAP